MQHRSSWSSGNDLYVLWTCRLVGLGVKDICGHSTGAERRGGVRMEVCCERDVRCLRAWKACSFKWERTVPCHFSPYCSNEKEQREEIQWRPLASPCHRDSCLCWYNDLLTPEGQQTNWRATAWRLGWLSSHQDSASPRITQNPVECVLSPF